MLSVAEYDAMEAEAIKGIDPEVARAFQPVQFIRSGFQTRIKDLSELPKFADHLVEPETPLYFKDGSEFPMSGWKNGFTEEEFGIVQKVRRSVVRATAKLGKPVRPMLMPLIHVAALRVINQLARHCMPLRVFEIGPGTGYLGPLLHYSRLQHNYHCMDITQSYVLWQALLHDACGMGARQIAWWGEPPSADIIYSNANLSEMTDLALRGVVAQMIEQLADSQLACLIYFHLGDPHHTPPQKVHDILMLGGFRLEQSAPITIWRLRGRESLGDPITPQPIDGDPRWTAREMAWCLPGEEPLDFNRKFVFGE